jgi:hypothetical protein
MRSSAKEHFGFRHKLWAGVHLIPSVFLPLSDLHDLISFYKWTTGKPSFISTKNILATAFDGSSCDVGSLVSGQRVPAILTLCETRRKPWDFEDLRSGFFWGPKLYYRLVGWEDHEFRCVSVPMVFGIIGKRPLQKCGNGARLQR